MSENGFIPWLRGLAKKGGKGVVNNIDARCLGRIADELERLAHPKGEVGADPRLQCEPVAWRWHYPNEDWHLSFSGRTKHDDESVIFEPLFSTPPARHSSGDAAKDYVLRAIATFEGDPADDQFQRGYLAALEVVRDEAFFPPQKGQL